MRLTRTAAAAAWLALAGGAVAASYDDIPDIEVYGQHFFYTNNGSQLYVLLTPLHSQPPACTPHRPAPRCSAPPR